MEYEDRKNRKYINFIMNNGSNIYGFFQLQK